VLIRPETGWTTSVRELADSSELVFFLAWRDVALRYRQTILGAAWVLFQPLATMLLFTIVFGRLGKMPSDGFPYPLFCYVALVVWQGFAAALVGCSNSLVSNPNLVSKVYFPRLVIPLAAVLPPLLDTAVASLLLPLLMAYYRVAPSPRASLFPAFVGLGFLAALSVGLWLAALNVRFRDVRYAVPVLMQFWMFASPVVYPMTIVPERWRPVYAINPMAVVIQGFRWALTGHGFPGITPIVVSVLGVIVLLVTGLIVFRKAEADMADVL
jgi:lipopolysaccharide transport system permease protein